MYWFLLYGFSVYDMVVGSPDTQQLALIYDLP